MSFMNTKPEQSDLGKKSDYDSQYNPEKLFPIPRQEQRNEIGIGAQLPFYGMDIWNHYEVSWLNEKGKPVVAVAEISYDCTTACIIESKSMKLYFNSFNNTQYRSAEELEKIIQNDIAERIGGDVHVKLFSLSQCKQDKLMRGFEGTCIDDLDISVSKYTVDASYLKTDDEVVEETLYSDLLKSNCLVTNQPDWASVQIIYKGKKIQREGLLKYLVSFRNHNEFHEQCIERIYMDIMHQCQPEELTVYGRYTRRGGLDINPYRSSRKIDKTIENLRLYRQ
jgi:7-cyano-7-deazaguanine reductase